MRLFVGKQPVTYRFIRISVIEQMGRIGERPGWTDAKLPKRELLRQLRIKHANGTSAASADEEALPGGGVTSSIAVHPLPKTKGKKDLWFKVHIQPERWYEHVLEFAITEEETNGPPYQLPHSHCMQLRHKLVVDLREFRTLTTARVEFSPIILLASSVPLEPRPGPDVSGVPSRVPPSCWRPLAERLREAEQDHGE
jgi:hypothetical protein